MSIINFGNALFVLGLILSSYSFSRGIFVIGLIFILVAIVGLLMNPPEKCREAIIMRTIKFSHVYSKMPADFGVSKLLEVLVSDSDYLHEGFVKYDTSFGEDGENYPLPRGKVLVMLLQTRNDNVLWTTIRRHTPSKYDYYKGLRGSFVKCEVK